MPFDADNHYYEAEDAFIRHMDPAMAKRCMQWAGVDGKRRLLVGGQGQQVHPQPHLRPRRPPGSLEDYFRGRNPDGMDMKTLFGELEPSHPAYRDRDARVALLDEQGLEGPSCSPRWAWAWRSRCGTTPEALLAAFPAFNPWLDEDWGFDRDGASSPRR